MGIWNTAVDENSRAPFRDVPKGDSVQERGAFAWCYQKWAKARAEAVRSKRGLDGEDKAYTVGLWFPSACPISLG